MSTLPRKANLPRKHRRMSADVRILLHLVPDPPNRKLIKSQYLQQQRSGRARIGCQQVKEYFRGGEEKDPDQSVFNRCRIGRSRLSHEFLLKGEPPPECIPCNCLLTIKHLLIECVDFNDVRQRFYQVPSLQDLFKTVKPEVILEFLKVAALYRLL